MLTIDYSVIEDWFVSHKSLSIVMLYVAIIMVTYGFMLYQPWLQYRLAICGVELMRKQLSVLQRSIEGRIALRNEQIAKVNHLEKNSDPSGQRLPPVLWLSHNLKHCKISHYVFSEDIHVPPGGQGGPTFNLTMHLNYTQALCVLSHFARYSSGWELSKMTMSRGEENKPLEMNFSGSL